MGAGDLLTADSSLFVVYSLSKSANVTKILNYNDVSHENIGFFNITRKWFYIGLRSTYSINAKT
jgi:hypothetical protein